MRAIHLILGTILSWNLVALPVYGEEPRTSPEKSPTAGQVRNQNQPNAQKQQEPKERWHGAPVIQSKRQEAPAEVPKDVKAWIADTFYMAPEFVDKQWGEAQQAGASLSAALEELTKDQYGQTARIVAQLMGTTNPELAKRVFKEAKAEIEKETCKAKPVPNECRFFEAVLFGLWAYPEKEEEKQAFCLAVVGNEKATEPKTTLFNLMGLLDTIKKTSAPVAQDVEKQSKDEGSEQAKDSRGNANEVCFGGKYAPYEEFKKAFEPEAKAVWEWDKLYNDSLAVIADPKASDEDKQKAFEAIKSRVGAESMISFGLQQHVSDWIEGKKDAGTEMANKTFRALAGIENGNKEADTRKLELRDGTPNNTHVEDLKIEWPKDGKAITELQKTDWLKEALAQKKPPYLIIAPRKPATSPGESSPPNKLAETTPSNSSEKRVNSTDAKPPATNPAALPKQLAEVVASINAPEIKQLVSKVGPSCIDCHTTGNGADDINFGEGGAFSVEELKRGIKEKNMLDLIKNNPLSPEEKSALLKWAKGD